MRQGTFALSQKELQRVAVISSFVKGALAHPPRGPPRPPPPPHPVRERILHFAPTPYAGFNDHHLCEKLVEKEGLSLGRETLRRLLRSAGIASPRKRRAPTHRQRRLARAREGEMLLLDASLHYWLEERGPQLTLLGFLDDATRRVLAAEFFFTEDARLFPPAATPLAPLRRTAQLLWGSPQRLRSQR